ncbi:EF-hand calcium-binding domain-containing protein 9-like [Antedon mediterranea]|uniref:EF-hand calcium-binding domain-containing protein 9-like n=1 Tax=Antedon mediterranea TaxID=105859 RepID=UPI003AF986A5
MKIKSSILQYLHLDKTYCFLTAKNVKIVLEYFKLLDVHDQMAINDIQFYTFMHHVTNLNKSRIYKVFDMLDVDGSGQIDFDEFYLLVCILISIQDKEEKQFIYRHSRTVFELLDEDGSQSISAEEFGTFGFLFNFYGDAVNEIFKHFDVSGDQALDYKEFKMFAMACIDRQNEIDRQKREKIEKQKQLIEEKQKRKQALIEAGNYRGDFIEGVVDTFNRCNVM